MGLFPSGFRKEVSWICGLAAEALRAGVPSQGLFGEPLSSALVLRMDGPEVVTRIRPFLRSISYVRKRREGW